jgi:hypothetical protein
MAVDRALSPQWEAFVNERTTLEAKYNRRSDTLLIRRSASLEKSALSLDVRGEYLLRVDPETYEVLGIEIEDFVNHFIPTHPEFRLALEQAHEKLSGKHALQPSLVSYIVERLLELFRAHPRQLSFRPIGLQTH